MCCYCGGGGDAFCGGEPSRVAEHCGLAWLVSRREFVMVVAGNWGPVLLCYEPIKAAGTCHDVYRTRDVVRVAWGGGKA